MRGAHPRHSRGLSIFVRFAADHRISSWVRVDWVRLGRGREGFNIHQAGFMQASWVTCQSGARSRFSEDHAEASVYAGNGRADDQEEVAIID